MRRWWWLGAALFLAGCSPVYVLRAACGEFKVLWRREPIKQVLARADLDATTRAKLRLVLDLRPFAADLGLRVGGSYRTYSPVDESQVVHLLIAAPKLKLELRTWWFPIVGRVPYKGFFRAGAARAEARALEQRGFDTVIVPSVAFSTLGWFDDPLLSTVLHGDRVSVASTVLHELLHNTFYAPSQAEFNESFATFAGGRGAIAFWAATEGEEGEATAAARARWEDAKVFSAFLGALADRLRGAYAEGLTPAEREKLFAHEKVAFARQRFATDSYRRFGAMDWNNALVLQQLIYHRDLRLFDEIYDGEGRDLRAAIRRVIALARGAADPFAALRAAMAGTTSATG